MNNYLIIESVAVKPHLETAGEVALELREQGNCVAFSYVGYGLPWTDWDLPKWLGWLGCSLQRRVQRFEELLRMRGVSILPSPLETGVVTKCEAFSTGFYGELSDLKEYRYGDAELGMGAASTLISWYGDSLIQTATLQPLVERTLMSAALVYERSRALIRAVRPDVVVTFNGRFATCKPILEAAAAESVRVIRHERGATPDKYELFDAPLHSYDYRRQCLLEAWTKAGVEREQIGRAFFKRKRGGDGIGWYSFVHEQTRGKVPPRAPGRRRIVYYSSSDDEYAATSDNYTPGPWPDQIRAVESLIRVFAKMRNVELVIRLHPHLARKSTVERKRWDAFSGDNIMLIPASSTVDSYALLDSADTVVSYGSTIGIEAVYWGKPSILIGPCIYQGLGVCIEPKNESELAHALESNIEPTTRMRENCLPYGHYYLTYGTPYRHYRPESLMEGAFLDDHLSWAPPPVQVLRRLGLGRLYNKIRLAMR